MSDLNAAKLHEVFPVERVGDLLIVSPIGDTLEFSNAIFQSEFARLKQLAAGEEFRNVLFDLSGAAYFGSEMIGSLVEIQQIIRNHRRQPSKHDQLDNGDVAEFGITAVCGLSDDMDAGLKIMHVDQLLQIFGTRNEAITALANQSVTDRMGRIVVPWKLVAAIAAVAIALAVIFTPLSFVLFGGSAVDDYHRVVRIYERWDARRGDALTPGEKINSGKRLERELAAMRDHVRDRDVSAGRFYAAEACRKLIICINSPVNPNAEGDFAKSLAIAKYAIEEEAKTTLPSPSGLTLPTQSKLEAEREKAATGTTISDPTSVESVPAADLE